MTSMTHFLFFGSFTCGIKSGTYTCKMQNMQNRFCVCYRKRIFFTIIYYINLLYIYSLSEESGRVLSWETVTGLTIVEWDVASIVKVGEDSHLGIWDIPLGPASPVSTAWSVGSCLGALAEPTAISFVFESKRAWFFKQRRNCFERALFLLKFFFNI